MTGWEVQPFYVKDPYQILDSKILFLMYYGLCCIAKYY